MRSLMSSATEPCTSSNLLAKNYGETKNPNQISLFTIYHVFCPYTTPLGPPICYSFLLSHKLIQQDRPEIVNHRYPCKCRLSSHWPDTNHFAVQRYVRPWQTILGRKIGRKWSWGEYEGAKRPDSILAKRRFVEKRRGMRGVDVQSWRGRGVRGVKGRILRLLPLLPPRLAW